MFTHEEAMALELAGMCCYERGIFPKAYSFLSHAIECYKTWGALAIAKRVENFLQSKFSSPPTEDPVEEIVQSKDKQPRKRSILD